MSKQCDATRVLYLDLELTCWDGPVPPGMRREIIQIGIVEANVRELAITRQAVYYIRPVHSTISEYCTELTGITPEKVKREGRKFTEVLASLTKAFGPRGKACFAWGDDEEPILDACLEGEVTSPFRMIDLGLLFRFDFGLERGASLEAALEMIGKRFEGRPHDALVDATNTAALHLGMIERHRTTFSTTLS